MQRPKRKQVYPSIEMQGPKNRILLSDRGSTHGDLRPRNCDRRSRYSVELDRGIVIEDRGAVPIAVQCRDRRSRCSDPRASKYTRGSRNCDRRSRNCDRGSRYGADRGAVPIAVQCRDRGT